MVRSVLTRVRGALPVRSLGSWLAAPGSPVMRVALALVLAVAFVSSANAQTQTTGMTLPDTGVDVGSGITAVITKIGTAVVVAVGGYFAFLAVRKAMKWARAM